MNKILVRLLPLVVFLIVIAFLWRGLTRDPREVPSPLINQSVPEFSLPALTIENDSFTHKDLEREISIVNIWATWCAPCREEHPVLMEIRRTTSIPIYGINYKDDFEQANNWLRRYGNPFLKVGYDPQGRVALDWGVYGAPETFLIDQMGVIQYKHVGTLTTQVWEETFLPLVNELRANR